MRVPTIPLQRPLTAHSAHAQVFDVAAVRAALQGRLHSLESELHQVRFRAFPRSTPAWQCTCQIMVAATFPDDEAGHLP